MSYADEYYMDGGGATLCAGCAEESREDYSEDFIPHFRPESGPHLNTGSTIHCDECSGEIHGEDGEEEE